MAQYIATFSWFNVVAYVHQRWYRIWSAGVDSGKILHFSFGPGSGHGVKNLGKTGPGSGVTFQFLQWQESVWSFLSKNMGKLRLDR